MCGIVCSVTASGSREDESNVCATMAERLSDVESSLAIISHRGPDGYCTWTDPSDEVILGHCRLSINDVSGGSQPISNEDATVSIVVNGEFYGFESIRDDLVLKGHTFKTNSDSEIALHLYEEYGETVFLDHLDGEFALVICDTVRRRLVIARDRFGVKPLYYTSSGSDSGSPFGFYCASEIKALLGVVRPRRPVTWDIQSVLHSGMFADPHRTAFEGIRKLPPAHVMVVHYNGPLTLRISQRRYWSVPFPNKDIIDPRSTEELILGVRTRLYSAVQQRLRSVDASVPVGVYLSGGVDSAAILGIATELHDDRRMGSGDSAEVDLAPEHGADFGERREFASSDRLHAFTIAFRESASTCADGSEGHCDDTGSYDESAVAQHTAQHCGAIYHELALSEADLTDAFEESVWHAEAPALDLNIAGKYLLSRFVSHLGFRVVLTGEGADENFAGYQFFRADFLREADGALPSGAHGGAQQGEGDSQVLGSELGLGLVSDVPEGFTEEERRGWLTELEAYSPWSWTGLPMCHDQSIGRQMLGGISTHRQLASLWGLRAELFIPVMLDAASQPDLRLGHGDCVVGPDPCLVAALGIPEEDQERMCSKWHPLHSALCVQQRTMLPNLLCCHLGDRTEMAHSVEGRPPFLCHRLVEFVSAVPPSYKLRLPKEKWLLREAVRPWLTEEVYTRPKQPFCSPPSAPEGAFATLIRRTVTEEAVAGLGWMDWAAVQKVLGEFLPSDPGGVDPAMRARARNCLCMVASYIFLSVRFHVEPWSAASAESDSEPHTAVALAAADAQAGKAEARVV